MGLVARRNRVAAVVTALAGAAGCAVASVTHGTDGFWSALLGLVLVLVLFSAGSLPFAVVGNGEQRGLAFLVLGMTYVLRLLIGVAVYGAASASADLESRIIGLSVIGCALAWVAAHVVQGVSRRHAPMLDI